MRTSGRTWSRLVADEFREHSPGPRIEIAVDLHEIDWRSEIHREAFRARRPWHGALGFWNRHGVRREVGATLAVKLAGVLRSWKRLFGICLPQMVGAVGIEPTTSRV